MNNINNINLTNTNKNEIYNSKRSYIPSPFPKSFFENSTNNDEYIKTPINAQSINKIEHNYIPSPYRQIKIYEINPQTEYVLQNSQDAINHAISLINGGF